MHSFFARGYGDGVVLVWDYRNGAQKVRFPSLSAAAVSFPQCPFVPKSTVPCCLMDLSLTSPWLVLQKVLERFQFQRPAEVVHTVLAGSDVIAYGGYSVTFWSTLAARV